MDDAPGFLELSSPRMDRGVTSWVLLLRIRKLAPGQVARWSEGTHVARPRKRLRSMRAPELLLQS